MTYYIVRDSAGEADRLVLAPNPAQAIRHVAKRYTAKAATTDDVAKFLLRGGGLDVAAPGGPEPAAGAAP